MSLSQIIREELLELGWRQNWWAVIFAVIAVSPAIGAIPNTQSLYYIALFICFLGVVSRRTTLCALMAFVLIAGALSILVSNPPSFFHSWLRFGLFCLVAITASPLVQSPEIRSFRFATLITMLKLCVLIGVISFIFYFMGINYMQDIYEVGYLESAGLFGGITRQSMLLGPMCGLASIYLIYKALKTRAIWYWIAAIPCIGCVLFAASRSAFIALIIGVLATVCLSAKSLRNLTRILFGLLLVGMLSFPMWRSALSGLEEKQRRNIDNGSLTISRNDKWANRIEEFSAKPIFGIGFGACDLNNKQDYSVATGTVEPGSSWLGVLSMTGLMGFIPLMLLVIASFRNAINVRSDDAALLMGLLVFISIHMAAEGYLIAGGSQLCILAWLIISCCYDIKYRRASRVESI